MMIIDTLRNRQEEMKRLQAREALRKNKSQQEKTDARFRILLFQAHNAVDILHYMKVHTNFVPTDELISSFISLFEILRSAVSGGLADSTRVEDGEQALQKIQATTKKEWTAFYSKYTGGTVSTLKVISGLDKSVTADCLERIQAAASWGADKATCEKMIVAMAEADTFISNLNMDQDVIAFLQKMNLGHATLMDLTQNVSTWIQRESLENKIRLSFVMK